MGELEMVGVDTGENGFFARGEFEAVTSINQMEFVTPEEIARNVVLEIKGSNTGVDVIAAIDAAIMVPSYRAGYLRGSAIEAMRRLERETNSHSIATGELGPPKLTKLLYEAHLLKIKYRTLQAVVEQARRRDIRSALAVPAAQSGSAQHDDLDWNPDTSARRRPAGARPAHKRARVCGPVAVADHRAVR